MPRRLRVIGAHSAPRRASGDQDVRCGGSFQRVLPQVVEER